MARALWRLAPAGLALAGGTLLLAPSQAPAYSLIGGSLGIGQRDVRVFDNFTDVQANDNTTPDPSFPGYTGAELAIWKAAVEWGSELHGDGQGDPHQPGDLGSGGANFDPTWQGNADGVGSSNQNIHSEIQGSSGGVLAFCETPISDGWRIRYYSDWIWDDGPGSPPAGSKDLQGIATHEYGHALGLGHSGVIGATMYATANGTAVAQRSIHADDIAGLQAIYGAKSSAKPRITNTSVDPASGTVTVEGSHFAATGNEVWFTHAGVSSAASDPIVRVKGAVSTDGTTITVVVPAGAGPGDLLVRVPGSGHASLSNAWPFDPAHVGPQFGPPVVLGIAPNSLPSVVNGPNLATITGSGFGGLLQATLGGLPVDPLRMNVLSDTTMTLDVPRQASLGPVLLELTNAFGTSDPAALTIVPPHPPVVALESPFLFSHGGLNLTVGAEPGTAFVLAGSTVASPSVVPGVIYASIGAQFSSLVVLGGGVVPGQGWTPFGLPISNLPFGTPIHVQAATLPPGSGLPYTMSTVASGTFYY